MLALALRAFEAQAVGRERFVAESREGRPSRMKSQRQALRPEVPFMWPTP
jgi:hypothetical protein